MTLIKRAILAFALMAGLSPVFAQAPPPVPALPDTERRTTYQLSASTCACNVNFALFGEGFDYSNWIEVFVNGTLMSQVGNWGLTSPTGQIQTIPRPITDAVLTFVQPQTGTIQIVGARRPRRITQFQENVGVPARNLNQAFTDVIAQNRETWDKINDVTGRGIFAPPGETLSLLSAANARANQVLGFDALGNIGLYTAASAVTDGRQCQLPAARHRRDLAHRAGRPAQYRAGRPVRRQMRRRHRRRAGRPSWPSTSPGCAMASRWSCQKGRAGSTRWCS
jgi:hypothetical protein